jgi:hypothetical protein
MNTGDIGASFWCRNICFGGGGGVDALFENYASLEFHNDFVYFQMFGRVVKFLNVCP